MDETGLDEARLVIEISTSSSVSTTFSSFARFSKEMLIGPSVVYVVKNKVVLMELLGWFANICIDYLVTLEN